MVYGRINAFKSPGGHCPRCKTWAQYYNWNGREDVCPFCGYEPKNKYLEDKRLLGMKR